MNCRECDEQITPAVDDHLQTSAKQPFFDHVASCPGCRRAYEAERFITGLIHQRLHMIKTPDVLTASVSTIIEREQQGGRSHGVVPLPRRTILSWSFGLAAVLLLGYLIVGPLQNSADVGITDHADVVQASLLHLAAMTTGGATPQVVSHEPTVLERYFAGKTEFPVRVHALRDYIPSGAVLNEAAGVPFAYVVYTGNGERIYVYQTCWRTIQAGAPLDLAPEIKRALLEGHPYVEEDADGRTMVFWTEGRTLCGAVARMQRRDLLSHLALAGGTIPATP